MKAKMNQSSSGSQKGGKKQKKKETAYYHVSVTKLQDAFEQQFFAHIFRDGQLDTSVQADNLSVVKKHEVY